MRLKTSLALSLALTAGAFGTSFGPALGAPEALDTEHHLRLTPEQAQDLIVLTDTKGHFLVVSKPQSGLFFMSYGDAKVLHELEVNARTFEPDSSLVWALESNRLQEPSTVLAANARLSSWTLRCGERTSALAIADEQQRTEVLAASFLPPRWQRHPYLLSRDNRGVYYYVDDLKGDEQDMQLYVGRPGKMILQTLEHVVSDSEGDILFTKQGKLRIDGRYGSMSRQVTWIAGKKRTELVHLGQQGDIKLIYDTLGVYDGQKLGDPCEDI